MGDVVFVALVVAFFLVALLFDVVARCSQVSDGAGRCR